MTSARLAMGCLCAALACGLAVAACGSSGSPPAKSAGRSVSGALRFSNCMRAHGVTNFPDSADGGINLAGTGVNPKSPAFKAAGQACRKLGPGATRPPQATEAEFRAAIRFAKCMRTKGFPSFPDPTRTDGPPPPVLIVADGLFFHVSANFDPNSDAAKRAMAACPT